MKTRIQSLFIVLAILVGVYHSGAAVTFNITPSAISNTYNGPITLQVAGLTTGDTVLVQKYLDANTNGVVDTGDILLQQFQLTDGQAGMVFSNGTVAVTNFNVPGDTDTTAGQITAELYPSFDFAQLIVGKYLYVLSSPAGHFAPPLTNSFVVTNFPFAQSIAGNVVSNSTSTTVPNAVVILFNPNLNGSPVGGTVANNAGAYSIKMPPGTYELLAYKSNFVADGSTAPYLNLGISATITTNLVLSNATQTISGKLIDTNNSSIGLAGVLLPVQTKNGGNRGGLSGLLTIAFTDTNGSFTARVTANQWKIGGNGEALAFKGYLSLQNKITVDTTTGSVSGVNIGLPKATAAFYGTVKDNLGNPLPNVAIYSSDNKGVYETDGFADTNGNYVATAIGGLSGDTWQVQEDYGGPANYLYSQGQNNITLSVGQAYQYNFTGILATNYINGNVQFNGSPVVGVQVYAYATIGALNYQSEADTDTNGNYSLNVANGAWTVNVYDCGCSDSDSLNNILSAGTYQDPPSQNATISNDNRVVNFIVEPPGGGYGQIYGYVTDTKGNPVIGVTVYANGNPTTTDGHGYYSFNVVNGSFDVSVDCVGLNSQGYQCVSDQIVNVSNDSVEQDFITQHNPPLLSSPAWHTNHFSLWFVGMPNQNYTVQMSTNLGTTNWVTLYVTNNTATNSFLLTDPNATNKQRFYRVLVGP